MTEDGVMQWRIAAGKREVTVELHHEGEPLGHYVFTSYDEFRRFRDMLDRAAFEGFGLSVGASSGRGGAVGGGGHYIGPTTSHTVGVGSAPRVSPAPERSVVTFKVPDGVRHVTVSPAGIAGVTLEFGDDTNEKSSAPS